MKLIYPLIVTLIASSANAECGQPVKYLTEGSPAPCNGYLFSPTKEQEVRNKVIRLDYVEAKLKTTDELYRLSEQRVDYYLNMSVDLNNKLQKEQDSKYIKYGLGFLAGVLTTSVIVHVTSK